MFDSRSRYFELGNLRYQGEHGRTIVYRARRFLPREPDKREWWRVEAGPSDRPDLLADRTLRNPDLFWRICDANGIVHPLELTRRPGREIRIPMPGV